MILAWASPFKQYLFGVPYRSKMKYSRFGIYNLLKTMFFPYKNKMEEQRATFPQLNTQGTMAALLGRAGTREVRMCEECWWYVSWEWVPHTEITLATESVCLRDTLSHQSPGTPVKSRSKPAVQIKSLSTVRIKQQRNQPSKLQTLNQCGFNVGQRRRRWPNIKLTLCQQTLDIDPVMVHCWGTVCDAGPAVNQHRPTYRVCEIIYCWSMHETWTQRRINVISLGGGGGGGRWQTLSFGEAHRPNNDPALGLCMVLTARIWR